MDDTLFLFVLPPLMLVPAMGALSMIHSRHRIGEELKRKSFHVGFGLLALSFPAIWTETWMAVFGLVCAFSWLTAVRVLPCLQHRFGSVLHDCRRKSAGEFYYALAVAGLFVLTDEGSLRYDIPLLILALADAAAAIAGRLVPSQKLRGVFAGKSVAGCLAFFFVAAIVCAVALVAESPLGLLPILKITLLVALLTTLTEALSRRGLDNFLVPFAAWGALTALQV